MDEIVRYSLKLQILNVLVVLLLLLLCELSPTVQYIIYFVIISAHMHNFMVRCLTAHMLMGKCQQTWMLLLMCTVR